MSETFSRAANLRTVRVTLEITHDRSWVNPEEWDWNEAFAEGLAVRPCFDSLQMVVVGFEESQP